jgi:5-methyltetrahydropteroyltriglutamate--homocysteine methyltransferase
VKLPAGKILVTGAVSNATDLVEHPELVGDRIITFAERIITFAEMVGQENVIAGTDCCLGGRYRSANRLGQAARCAPNSVSYFEL